MYRIVTLDHSTAGTPEDGFGLDEFGNFFVAISKHGFDKDREAVIFVFDNKKVIATTAKIINSRNYKADRLRSIRKMAKKNSYDTRVIEKIIEYHLVFLGRRKYRRNVNTYLSRVHVNRIISNILSRVYKHVGSHYDRSSVNLKKHKYQDFYFRVKDAGFIWQKKTKSLSFLSFFFIIL